MQKEPIREFRIGVVLEQGLKIFFSNFLLFGFVTIIFIAIFLILGISAGLLASGSSFDLLYAIGIASLFMVFFFSYIVTAALAFGTFETMLGRKPHLREMVVRGFKTFFPVLGLSIIASIMIGLGLFALFFPGFMIASAFWVAVPVLVIERCGIFESLSRSRNLTRGHRWKIFGILALIWIISQIGQTLALTLGAIDDSGILSIIVFVLILLLSIAIPAVISSVGYFHLRQIHDGVDIDHIATIFD